MFRQGFIRHIYAYFTADNDNADFRANGLSATFSLWHGANTDWQYSVAFDLSGHVPVYDIHGNYEIADIVYLLLDINIY